MVTRSPSITTKWKVTIDDVDVPDDGPTLSSVLADMFPGLSSPSDLTQQIETFTPPPIQELFEEAAHGGLAPGRVLRGVEPMLSTFEARGALGAVLSVFMGDVVTMTFSSISKSARMPGVPAVTSPVYERYTIQAELEQTTPPGYTHDAAASEALQLYGVDVKREISTDSSTWKFTTHVNPNLLIYARGYADTPDGLINHFEDEKSFQEA